MEKKRSKKFFLERFGKKEMVFGGDRNIKVEVEGKRVPRFREKKEKEDGDGKKNGKGKGVKIKVHI